MSLNIRILEAEDVTPRYVAWLEDEEVKRYSDNQYRQVTLEGQYEYVRGCLANASKDLYGIFDAYLHIGNILISDLDSVHNRAEIAYLIGDRSYWGKGAGTFAIAEMVKLASKQYALNKLYAGLAEGNIGSRRVLEKNGFMLEGRRARHLYYNGVYSDQLDYGLLLP
jgi:ribosomal-protein-alanine N-acetyltransferase